MKKQTNFEIEIDTDIDLSTTIREFINTLVETDQYHMYEITNEQFQKDKDAQEALREYQMKAKDLQTKQMFSLINEAEQKDLERLWIAFTGFNSVQEFFKAQEEFQSLCRECAQVISDQCGLDYATSCGASCCG